MSVQNVAAPAAAPANVPVKRNLPSPIFAPHHQAATGMRFTVRQGGDIHVAPVRFGARRGDFLLWAVVNASGGPIRVAISRFLLKANIFDPQGAGDPIAPVDFFGANNSVELGPDETGFIGGTVNWVPQSEAPFFTDGVSYTIEVRSTAIPAAFPDVDYDPDGDIKP